MISRIYRAYKIHGWLNFTLKSINRLGLNIVAIPIALLLSLIYPMVKVRFIKLYSSRIGQYGLNTHLMLCAMQTNLYKDQNKYHSFFYADPLYSISNVQLHKMWKQVLPILPFGALIWQIDRFMRVFQTERVWNSALKAIFENSEGGNDRWLFFQKIKYSFIQFNDIENEMGAKLLAQLGIKNKARYICLLVRDASYLKSHMPDTDWAYHNYRNAKIANYKQAALYLAERGYYVIRMGKKVEEGFELNHPKIIDYANHPLRSDFLDIYLTANCYFFISTSSGIDSVAQIFQRPILITNFSLTDLRSYLNWNLLILKKVFDKKNNHYLSLTEIINECQLFTDTLTCKGIDRRALFKSWGEREILLIENSEDEILAAVKEMLLILKDPKSDSKTRDESQADFWKNLPYSVTEGINTYDKIKMRIAVSFLKMNPCLMPQLPIISSPEPLQCKND